MTKEGGTRKIKTAYRLDEIMVLLRDDGPISVQEVADELDIAKSTAYAYLTTLHELEYVVRESGGYSLGLKLLDYAMARREQLPIVEPARPILEQLASSTGEAVYLLVEERGRGVHVAFELGDMAAKAHSLLPRVGHRRPLHCIPTGKAILADLPDEQVERIIKEHGLPQMTEHTIGSPAALFDEFETIRNRGYALGLQEVNYGVHSIGASVVVEGEVMGAIGISGPANRLTTDRMEETVASELLAATNEAELMLTQH